jgi:hypothetical protein
MFSKAYFSSATSWDQRNTIPFNELILSWNGHRPAGKWTFWVSVQGEEWLKYAEWGAEGQRSFASQGARARCYQDIVIPKTVCSAFRVKVEGEDLEKLQQLCVCVSLLDAHKIVMPPVLAPVRLSVKGQSQLQLHHSRNRDMCSPTSTTTALRFLLQGKQIDPVVFAAHSRDEGFDIYGNWVLNIAEAFQASQIPCHVERLTDFTALHGFLTTGIPVVVSVKGTLPGAPKPYAHGHLMCVTGYDAGRVYCIDPAFPDDSATHVSYPLHDFLRAWGERKNLSYVFKIRRPLAT